MDKVRIRKHVGNELENFADVLNLKPIQLLHLILEDWIVKNKISQVTSSDEKYLQTIQ